MKYIVLDSGALFNIDITVLSHLFFTTPSVIEEVRNSRSQNRIEYAKSAGRLEVRNPIDRSIHSVRDVAKKSGDLSVLSDTDIEILALAIELKQENPMVEIWSNDFAIQNVAYLLNIKWHSPSGKEIKKAIVWQYFCPGCGKRFKVLPSDGICDVCGTPLRRYRAKRKRI